MPFYNVKHYKGDKWLGDTGLSANNRPHAIRLGLEREFTKGADRWIVNREADMGNATEYHHVPGKGYRAKEA